jgi:hypothetical protein
MSIVLLPLDQETINHLLFQKAIFDDALGNKSALKNKSKDFTCPMLYLTCDDDPADHTNLLHLCESKTSLF